MPTATLQRPAVAAASSTPTATHRDQFVDLLRVLAIAVVVLEHWLFPVLAYDGETGQLLAGNALTTPGAWMTTWVGQVMPLVFFAGGVANATSWRRRSGPRAGAGWLGDRVRRLAWPVLPLAAVWLPLPHLLVAVGVPAQPVALAAQLAGQLLWFLAAYLVAVVATPLAVRAHDRLGARALAALVAAAALVDVMRFNGPEWLGYLNVAFVWLAVHQVGLLYADGRLAAFAGRRAWQLAVAGYAAAAALVALGPYPAAMIGLPGATTSNVNPPTLALVALAAGQLGLAFALRPTLLRVASRPRGAAAYGWMAPRAMSVYLWHMPALSVVAGIVVVGAGLETPAPGTSAWWAGIPIWLAALAVTLLMIVRLVARLERPPTRRRPAPPPSISAAAVATALVASGLIGLMIMGFGHATWSTLASMAVALGVALTWSSGAAPPVRGVGLAPPRTGQPTPWERGRAIARLVP